MATEECPNCKQLTNTSFSRLVKDTCGHTKCRMCLLYEEHGCLACQRNTLISTTNQSLEFSSISNNYSEKEVSLPLELVINKDNSERNSTENILNVNVQKENNLNTIIGISTDFVTPAINSTNNESLYHFCLEKSELSNKVSDNPIQTCNMIHSEQNSNVSYNKLSEEDLIRNNSTINMINDKNTKHPDRSHISVVPGVPERYKCNACGKIFRNKKGTCYHDSCVTGIKPYQCKLCNKSFVKHSHYEYHERVHSGYKPYKCTLCEKSFPQQNKLNRHMFSHSKEKQFICPQCDKKYSKKDDLKNHLNIHNNTNLYSCKSCNKTFHVITNLKRHMKTHASERPYSCDQCAKSFKDNSLLLRHKRIHEKDRPFSCAHCNKVFLSKSELRRHLTIHSDEKPFSCKFCQIVFRRKDNLNRHIRHHHSEDTCVPIQKSHNLDQSLNKKILKRKSNNSKPKRKTKKQGKIQPCLTLKSPPKVPAVYLNSHEQINSRLDSMGNITPVIRMTGELSNAVPVINGPISIKKPEEKTDSKKKTLTYMEPIPPAEAVVINKRIEERLYSQVTMNHNYYFRSSSSRIEKQSPAFVASSTRNLNFSKNSSNKNIPHEVKTSELSNKNGVNLMSLNIQSLKSAQSDCLKINIQSFITNNSRSPQKSKRENMKLPKENNKNDDHLKDSEKKNVISSITGGYINHTSEIKNCPVQDIGRDDSNTNNKSNNSVSDESKNTKYIKDLTKKSECNIHWRRRTAEILKL